MAIFNSYVCLPEGMWHLAASASVDLRSTKATDLLFSFGPLRALAVAAAVAQDFKTGASPF